MPRLRLPILGFTLALLAPTALPAQTPNAPTPGHALEMQFSLPVNEFYRLWLDGGQRYRVSLTGRGLSLALTPIDQANEPVLIEPLLLGSSASNTTVYTVQVRDDGVYNLRAIGGEAGRAVTVRLSEAPRRDTTTKATARPAAGD